MDDRGRTKADLVQELVRMREKLASAERVAERDLAECETRLRGLSEQSMAGVYVVKDGVLAYVNREFADIFGYAADEIVGKKRPEDLAFPEDRPLVADRMEKQTSKGAGPGQYEFRGRRKDGKPVYVELYGTPAIERGAPCVIGMLLDRTDQKRLAAELVQSEKIKALGALAGGIAHDFNNLLMAIQGHTSLLLHRLSPSDAAHAKLKGIEELIKSGSEMTKKLLGFARGARYETRPCDLNLIIVKTLDMFGRTRKEISIRSSCDEDLCAVDADAGQIEQMLLNLCLNAWQAMPRGGTLSLASENTLLDRRFVQPYGLEPGKYARISVTDTGEGMDEKTKERIFEPFFTTRKVSGGTGLGLVSVYNAVKGHGGIITVYSEKGLGTTFHIYLPASKSTQELVSAPAAESWPVEKGGERVLLVDDEEAVITVSKDMLEVLGYTVTVARSGQEAIDIYHKNHDGIDAVILDVVMPDMGGEETLSRLRAVNPSVVVALSSGYSLDGRVSRIMEQGCKVFIQKPFTINVLSQKLREALGPAGKG